MKKLNWEMVGPAILSIGIGFGFACMIISLQTSRRNEREADVRASYAVRQSARDALEIAALKSENHNLRQKLAEVPPQRQSEQPQAASWVAPFFRPLKSETNGYIVITPANIGYRTNATNVGGVR